MMNRSPVHVPDRAVGRTLEVAHVRRIRKKRRFAARVRYCYRQHGPTVRVRIHAAVVVEDVGVTRELLQVGVVQQVAPGAQTGGVAG